MHLCYIDESGTSSIPGNTSHFILCGLAIPIEKWKSCEKDISKIKAKYNLTGEEIHTGWIVRNYTEQNKIPNFETLPYQKRKSEVDRLRKIELLKLQKQNNSTQYKQTRKNYIKTNSYTHLTLAERKNFILEIATKIGSWSFARIFAECIDKIFFDPSKAAQSIDEQSFEQIISRFQSYLKILDTCRCGQKNYGLIIHDNNDTIAKRHTDLMKLFHKNGTLWTKLDNIIETPLFVNSELTAMIQLADVCAYSLRRYLENQEIELFNEIYKRADRKDSIVVGIRHFSDDKCSCEICKKHKNGTI